MTVEVLVEPLPDGSTRATLLGLAGLVAEGPTEAEALNQLRHLLTARLAGAKIVPLSIEQDESTHPWVRMAERFRANPLLDDVAAAIERHRREQINEPLPTP